MKFGIIVVIALIASAFGLHFLLADPGEVLIRFRGTYYEMTVAVLALLIIGLFVAV